MSRLGAPLAVFAVVAAGVGIAQKVISAKAGLVYFVQGRVFVDGGARLKTGATIRQLADGETLLTERGRVEVLLNPGTVLRLGEMSRLRMESVQLIDARASIESGSAVVTVSEPPKLDRVELHAGGGVVVLRGSGIYRIDASGAKASRSRLRVYSGQASVRPAATSTGNAAPEAIVKSGYAVTLDDCVISKFDTKEKDELEDWAEARSRRPAGRGPKLLPPHMGWGDDPQPFPRKKNGGSQNPVSAATAADSDAQFPDASLPSH